MAVIWLFSILLCDIYGYVFVFIYLHLNMQNNRVDSSSDADYVNGYGYVKDDKIDVLL